MGYDVCVYNLYGHRTISCFGFRRRSELEPYGDCRQIVRKSLSILTLKGEIIPNPSDVREDSLRFLTEPLRSPYDRRKNRKTVTRRHVVWAPYGDTAIIVHPPHDFLSDNLVTKPYGDRRDQTTRTPYELYIMFAQTLRLPYGLHVVLSERSRKLEQEIV